MNDWRAGTYVSTYHLWSMREFRLQTMLNGSTVSKSVSGFITKLPKQSYEQVDSTFVYNSPTINSFRGVSTPNFTGDNSTVTYNCLAYAVGVNNRWMWPWSGNPTHEALNAYMSKSYPYMGREGDKYVECETAANCDVIYYSNSPWGSGSDGHFAKVVERDASGNPTKIMSKWGSAELIQSTSLEPFSSVYGVAKAYYKLAPT